MQAYSNPERADDPHALPDIEVYELTAHECAAMDEDAIAEYMRKPQYVLAGMNSRTQDAMLDAMVAELGIRGGWFWQSAFPGCMPDGPPMGPFATQAQALADAQQNQE